NDQGEILLVRHPYMKGWELPGGGIERGELAGEAIALELVEEAGIRAWEEPRLVSIHNQDAHFKGDHVLFYRVDRWEQGVASKQGEIAEAVWVSLKELPIGLTAGARRRIGEALCGEAVNPRW